MPKKKPEPEVPDPFLAVIGANIERLRKGQWTQTELAAEVGRKQAWLQKVEAGTREAKLEDLIRISAVLGVKLADLVPENYFEKKKKNPLRSIDK